MKRKAILFLTMIFAAFLAKAQIIIDLANYPTPANDTQSIQAVSISALTIPQAGKGMTWNYGAATPVTGKTSSTVYAAPPLTGSFSSTTRSYLQVQLIGPDTVKSSIYLTNNANGYSYSGYSVNKRQAYSIPLSGGDSLIFPVVDSVQTSNPQYIIKYPAAYNSNWSYSARLTNHFVFYTTTPISLYLQGLQIIHRMVTDTVVGWGTMAVPVGVSGSAPSQSYPVIMVKESWVDIDSFYIQGLTSAQVANLISSFGLSQGDTTSTYSYIFYRAGYATPLMVFNTDPYTTVTSAGYDPNNTSPATGIQQTDIINNSATVFPNPVTTSSVEFSFEKQDNAPMILNIVNSLGQVEQSTPLNQAKGNVNVQVNLPSGLANGIYYYNITEAAGNEQMNGKFILNR